MTDLSNLKAPEGANEKKKRVGRGPGSTFGTTAGRGTKGQNARSGGRRHPRFEGGQTPLFKRLPKWGFSNEKFRKNYSIVNIDKLNELFEEGDEVTPESLVEAGAVRKNHERVKVLGRGEITKALTVKAHKFSTSAQAAIEDAGGSVEVI